MVWLLWQARRRNLALDDEGTDSIFKASAALPYGRLVREMVGIALLQGGQLLLQAIGALNVIAEIDVR